MLATPERGPRRARPVTADAAVRQLYARHAVALHRYVARFCPDRASADDIVQETFIRAWRHLPQLSSEDLPVRPWLFRVARNLLIDADRAARSRPVTVQARARRGGLRRHGAEPGPGPAARYRRPRPAIARAPRGAGGGLLRGMQRREGRPPARDTATARHRSRLHYALQALRGQLEDSRSDRLAMIRSPVRRTHPRPPTTARRDRSRPGCPSGASPRCMLLAAAALDLTRCGLVAGPSRRRGSRRADVGGPCRGRGQHLDRARMPARRALVRLGRLSHRHGVGAASLRVRFHAVYTIPDRATAALGVLVAVGVLATAGRAGSNA